MDDSQKQRLKTRDRYTRRRARYVQARVRETPDKVEDEVRRLSRELFVSKKTIRRDLERNV